MKLKYSIMENSVQKQMNKEKFEGDGIIREMEKQIIKNQNNKVRQYTIEQKEQIFNKGFNQALQKIKKTMKISSKNAVEYDRIKADY